MTLVSERWVIINVNRRDPPFSFHHFTVLSADGWNYEGCALSTAFGEDASGKALKEPTPLGIAGRSHDLLR